MRPTWVEVMPSVCGLTSSPVTELAIVICSPSRIHAAPRPATMRVWNGDQLRRSSLAGMVLRMRFGASAATLIEPTFARLSRRDPARWYHGPARPPRTDARRPSQPHRHKRGDAVDGRELHAAVDQRSDPERGDPVADLVAGDHAAGDGRREGDQLLLPEADRQRQERRA